MHVQNRFFLLQSDDDNQTQEYEKFIQANNEAKELCVPKKERKRMSKRSKHPEVEQARKKLVDEKAVYALDQSEDQHRAVKQAQEKLFDSYKKVKEEEVAEMASMIERECGGKRYGTAWKVINSITERKKAKEGEGGNS